MPTVQIEGVGKVQFPDDMTPEQITAAIETEILPQRQPRTTTQELGRQAALTGRAVGEGVVDLAAIPANALGAVLNAGMRALGMDFQFPEQSQAFSQALTDAGVPAPETDREQLVNTIGRRATGAAVTIGAGTAISGAAGTTGVVGESLSSNPVLQGVGAASGPIAGDIAREAGAGQAGQAVADLAGSVGPSVVATSAKGGTRAAFRGGEAGRQRVEENLDTFTRVGTTPTVGQATESRAMRGAESLLSRSPGGAGPVVKKAEQQADELAIAIEQRASELVRKTSAEQAGRHIQRSVRGEGGFMDRFKAQQSKLFDELDKFVPKGTRVDVSKTKDALAALNAEIPGAPNVSKFFQNARMRGIEGALKADTEGMSSIAANPELADAFKGAKLNADDAALFESFLVDGKLPYEALKKLRTLVGNELADSTLASDVPRSKWKALYGALSEDLKTAADGAGPGAQAAWTRANNYTRAGMRRIETIESVIDRNGGPEAIFRAATANTKEGATTLRAVMQSVDKEGQKVISATVLRRLGLAKAGVQGELGDRFSTESFLTNWNLLSTEAKRTLFDRYGPRFRSDMDKVAKVAANLREGSQVFRNPSGTAQATTQGVTAGAFAISALTGQVGTAGTIAAGVVGANLTARLFRNPRFVRWLSRSTEIPTGAYATAVNSLASQAKEFGDQDLAAAAELLKDQKNDRDEQTDRERQRR